MYKRDPKRREADKWHNLLNNGYHYVLTHPITGAIVEKANTRMQLAHAQRLRPMLIMIEVDRQI